MSAVDDFDGFADFNGIPNEKTLPHLHAITSRKMAVLQCPDLMKYCQVEKGTLNRLFDEDRDDQTQNKLSELQQELLKASQKLIAIFKLILKGDENAANYLLFNLLSKVHSRTDEGLAYGHFNINLSGVSAE